MNTHFKRIAGRALVAVAAVATLAAPTHARAAELLSGAEEIPAFVLERVELASAAHAPAPVRIPRESR